MPELPEVETVVRTIGPRLVGRIIQGVWCGPSRVFGPAAPDLAERLAGRQILAVRRHGKTIVVDLNDGQMLTIHLGMTGRLVPHMAIGPHTRAVFELDEGAVEYTDIRQFGRIEVGGALSTRLSHLGPDALEISFDELKERLAGRPGRIKALLLNQQWIRGLGNIYADEILFAARIHPLARGGRLGPARARRLWEAMRAILREAIAAGGSSVSDYVDGEGKRGSYQIHHRVYRRTGAPCAVCGTPIRRIAVAQRSTHYCPQCQKV